jgi:hypothetical protein
MARGRLPMRKIRDVLRLSAEGLDILASATRFAATKRCSWLDVHARSKTSYNQSTFV